MLAPFPSNSTKLIKRIYVVLFSVFIAAETNAVEMTNKVEAQVRLDERSSRSVRYQYRVRAASSIRLEEDSNWSFNSYIATGSEFANAHNTFGSDESQTLYLRRAYVQYDLDSHFVQAGVIPTFKGRVSSTGLSKDGFIKGVRGVYAWRQNALIELVLGSIEDLRASRTLVAPTILDYFEVELSFDVNDVSSMEVGLEHMTELNFLRLEYRYRLHQGAFLNFELVNHLGSKDSKVLVGVEGEFVFNGVPLDYFAYYNYVGASLERRADLTEDFIDTGHSASVEIEVPIELGRKGIVFFRSDVYQDNSRFITGLKFKF